MESKFRFNIVIGPNFLGWRDRMSRYIKLGCMIVSVLVPTLVGATLDDGEKIWGGGSFGNLQVYSRIVPQIVEEKYFYAAIPLIKEILGDNDTAPLTPEMDESLDDIILSAGVRQFELLPARMLDRSKSPSAQYILSKKYFRAGEYRQALEHIVNVPDRHPLGPFSLLLHASALSIEDRQDEAIAIFKRCQEEAQRAADDTKNSLLEKELLVVRDQCVVGVPRAMFAQKKI